MSHMLGANLIFQFQYFEKLFSHSNHFNFIDYLQQYFAQKKKKKLKIPSNYLHLVNYAVNFF